jgi:hypothetical protein
MGSVTGKKRTSFQVIGDDIVCRILLHAESQRFVAELSFVSEGKLWDPLHELSEHASRWRENRKCNFLPISVALRLTVSFSFPV